VEYGAIGLFVDQAQAADPRFRVTDENVGSLIQVCRHLDGLALAIKLAAVRLPLFGLSGLEQRLGDRLKLLADASRSAPTRQQTLRAALDWSYGLLSAEEQTTFRHLGVFAGACGFSLELAGAVAGQAGQDEWAVIDHVSTLLDHSLLVHDGADPPRYRLLESARDYALHQLAERHELDAAEERFARAMNSVMERFDDARWTTPDMPLLSAFARELDNVRLAIGWSLEHDPRLAKALVGASSYFFLLLDLMHEYQGYVEVLEPLVSSDDVDVITARYWLARALAETNAGFPSARAGERAASLFRAIGYERGIAASLCVIGFVQVYSVAQWSATQAEMDSLAPEAWPFRTKVWRSLAEAAMHIAQERFDEALSVAEAGLVFARSRAMVHAESSFMRSAITAELALGRLDDALRRSREQIAAECRWRGRALEITLGTHAAVLTRQGRCAEARVALAEFFEASRRTGWHSFGTFFGNAFVELAFREQRYSPAATLLGYACKSWGRPSTQRRWAELLAALETVLDAESLERLLAEGKALDEEAVCALTLETGVCG